jgi:hypothetical protein
MDGISMAVGVKALGKSAKNLQAGAEAEAAARLAEEMSDRPDASPRPNNLDYHEGFRRVNSNVFLRRCGASLGVVDEVPPNKDGVVDTSLLETRAPSLFPGLTN